MGEWNRNVRLALAVAFMSSAARGVWAFTTLSVYLKMLAGTSTAVGGAEGAQGVAQALAAVVAGVVADRARRDTVLHTSALIGVAACGLLSVCLLGSEQALSDNQRYWFMTGALAVMGCYQGISTTCLDTLFADSVQTGQRSKFEAFRFALTQVSSVSGPIICVALFFHFGNEWTRPRLTEVFLVGVLLNLVPVLTLLLLSDDHSLGLDSESHYIPSTPGGSMHYQRLVDIEVEQQQQQLQQQSSQDGQGISAIQDSPYAPLRQPRQAGGELNSGRVDSGRPLLRNRSCSAEDVCDFEDDNVPLAPATQRAQGGHHGNAPLNSGYVAPRIGCITQSGIPVLLVISDVISALGSGMTVKFFPLFFKQKLELSPIQLNTVYILLPLFMTMVSVLGQRVARRVGRVQVCVVLSFTGCVALLALAYVEDHGWHIVLPIYFLSTLQHCSRPLRKSILMDFVPKSRRARVNSIESVTRLNWSGSAVLGGLSIDHHGFGHLFAATAAIQLVSWFILALVLPLVPVREVARIPADLTATPLTRAARAVRAELRASAREHGSDCSSDEFFDDSVHRGDEYLRSRS